MSADDTPDDHSRTGRVRALSRDLIVQELKRGPALTQPELTRRTGLSRPTVNGIISELERQGRIERRGKMTAGRGRPAQLLSLRTGSRGLIAAADIGHAHIHVAVATMDGDIVDESYVEIDGDASGVLALSAAATELKTLLSAHQIDDLLSVALGVPGPLERENDGTARSGGVMAGWSELNPLSVFRQSIAMNPLIQIENDAHLGAIGEHAYGAARGNRSALYVKVGSGVGAGLMIDNLLYRGGHGTAGEIGHVLAVEQGEMCRCGGRGCLETIASTTYALRTLQAIHGRTLTMDQMFGLLTTGDAGAVRLFEDIGRSIGIAIAGTVSALDPQIVVIGSPLTEHSGLTNGVLQALERQVQPFVAQRIRVVPGQLAHRASLMGGIARAMRAVREAS